MSYIFKKQKKKKRKDNLDNLLEDSLKLGAGIVIVGAGVKIFGDLID